MRVKITTDRQPWAGGRPHDQGDTPDLEEAEALALIDAGFAEAAPEGDEAPAPRRRRAAEA